MRRTASSILRPLSRRTATTLCGRRSSARIVPRADPIGVERGTLSGSI
ncbi:MAG: hypothetical protein ACLVEX_15225 [Ruthenibacterium lactatiformans]